MTTLAATNHEPRTTNKLQNLFLSEYLVLGLTILLFLPLAPFTPGLASGANLLGILAYLLPLFIVAIGMTLVMITGGIDLSVTSIIALTSVVGAKLLTDGGGAPTVVGVLAMLALGAGLGAVNGAIITLLRLPAFIVTLASMMFLSGFAIWLTQSKNIFGSPPLLPCNWPAPAHSTHRHRRSRFGRAFNSAAHGLRTLALRGRAKLHRCAHLGRAGAHHDLRRLRRLRILRRARLRDAHRSAGDRLPVLGREFCWDNHWRNRRGGHEPVWR